MIREVTIKEFGPEGLLWAYLEAPGSMCVMTVPGLNCPPDPLELWLSGGSPAHRRKRRTYVIAKNPHQFHAYCEARGLKRGRDASYVVRDESLQGLREADFILTGTYYDRYDWPKLEAAIGYIPDATVRIDQY